MKTETERIENKWYQQLQDAGTHKTAEELLHIMRPEAEEILLKYDMDQPPSQSYRALRCIDKIEELRHAAHLRHRTTKEIPKEWLDLSRDLRALKNFLAVHRTVWILEGRPL